MSHGPLLLPSPDLCGRNSNKFLRESGYCAGYFRFGAICSMLLARLCTGAALPDLAQLMVLAGILGAEVLEDSRLFLEKVSRLPLSG